MPVASEGVSLAPLESKDRSPIAAILEKTGLFRPGEIAVAMEVLDDALFREGQTDYVVYTALSGGDVAGWVCFGPNSMTEGTFELYWIAVDPDRQSSGIGRLLLERAESDARRMQGRIIVAETSSRDDYGSSRSFYRRLGYREEGRLRDYYAAGDDKVFFVKHL